MLQQLKRHGIPTISSDELAHNCLRKGHPCYVSVLRRFGRQILGAGLQIDRSRLAKIVFSKPSERRRLEQQIHPWVIRGLKSFIRKHRGMIALDIPLLYETRLEKLVDAVVVVSAPRAAQVSRLKRRNHLDAGASLQRIRAQWPLAAKIKRADYVLSNNGRLSSLNARVGSF